MYNGKNGELMNQIVAPGMVRVSRRRLRALCSDGITIQYGKQLTDVTYSNINGDVTAHFADGSSVKGDILIGTDGPQSMVRRHLFGIEKAAPTPTKIVANATLVRYDNAEVAKNIRSSCPIIGLSFSPEGVFSNISGMFLPVLHIFIFSLWELTMPSVQDVIDPSDPTSWSFQLFMSWLGDADASLTGTDRLKVLKTVAEGLAEPFRTANLSIPSGTQVFNDKMSYWIPVAWDDRGGKITLAGDAAHPMPPCMLSRFPVYEPAG
jgi:2-polyprenyl-6-methoxyphenol hydroxylase-like FAD-dependent oxidoreductase